MAMVQKQIRDMLDEIFEFAHSKEYENMGKQEFADYVGMSYNCLWRLRTGRTIDPRSSTLLKLFKAVGLDHQLAAMTGMPMTIVKKKGRKYGRKQRRYRIVG